jgi:hypothetical protein
MLPGRADAALQYLHYCRGIESPPPSFDGMRAGDGRDLAPTEVAAREAALTFLRLYFTGEVILPEPGGPPESPGNGPQVPAFNLP